MDKCDVIILSSDDEHSAVSEMNSSQNKNRKVNELKNKTEKVHKYNEDNVEKVNKAYKRIHPQSIDSNTKEEKMNDFNSNNNKFLFAATQKLSPNKSSDLWTQFLAVCKENDAGPTMEKILQKAHKYYTNTQPGYKLSKEFHSLLSSKISEISAEPRRLFVFIKEIVDEMRIRKVNDCEPAIKRLKLANGLSVSSNNVALAIPGPSSNSNSDTVGTESKDRISQLAEIGEDKYTNRKIKKLANTLKALHRRIEKLEQKEVDLEEDNNSIYIKTVRYKERFCKVHHKLCELTGEPSGERLSRNRISFTGTDNTEINKCIEKFVNKTGQFPDFHDILSLVRSVHDNGKMKPENIRRIAEDAFLSVGKQLQRQRQMDSWSSLSAYLKNEADPADCDAELESELTKNMETYGSRIQNIIDSFVDQQDAQKLEPEEVPDEEANNSGGSEQEEGNEDEEDEGEEEKDFVEKVLRGEEGLSSDEDPNIETDKGSGDDESKKLVIEDKEHYEECVEKGNHCDDNSTIIDKESGYEEEEEETGSFSENVQVVHSNRFLGPVSPPVLGENLNNRFLEQNLDSISNKNAEDVEKSKFLGSVSPPVFGEDLQSHVFEHNIDNVTNKNAEDADKSEFCDAISPPVLGEDLQTCVSELNLDNVEDNEETKILDPVSPPSLGEDLQNCVLEQNHDNISNKSVEDVDMGRFLGPVSPPVLGEDLQNRVPPVPKLCIDDRDDNLTECKESEQIKLHLSSDTDSNSDDDVLHSSLHLAIESESAESDQSKLESESLEAVGRISNPGSPSVVSETYTASSKQLGKPDSSRFRKSVIQNPLQRVECEADTEDDLPSPSLLSFSDMSEVETVCNESACSSSSSGVVVGKELPKASVSSNREDHTFVVTKMEVTSSTSVIQGSPTDTGRTRFRKFVRKIPNPMIANQRRSKTESAPDVITIE